MERLYGLKTVVIVPENSARGLDPHQGTVTLFDGETGQTIAVLNASPITAIRTAAVSALATRELARADARFVLAIVGTGHQGRAHQRVLPAVLPFDEVLMVGRGEVEAAVRHADVVVTATSAEEPVIRRGWLKDGVHINAVGACFRRESWTRTPSRPRRSSPTAASRPRTSRATIAWPWRTAQSAKAISQPSSAMCSRGSTRAVHPQTR